MPVNISYTANNKYQDSPRSWYLHYQLNLREEVQGSALSFGNAIDIAQEVLLLEKDLVRAKEVFLHHWKHNHINGKREDLRTTDKIKWSKSDAIITDDLSADELKMVEKGYNEAWVAMRHKGLQMLEAYNDLVLPHIKEVLAIQQYAKIENDKKDVIRGYIDLIAVFELDKDAAMRIEDEKLRETYLELEKYNGKVIIFDNKTSSAKYKEDSVRESDQLGTYFDAPLDEISADFCGYIVIPKKFRKNKEPKIPIQIIIDSVSEEKIHEIFEEYDDTIKGIKLGEFPCTGGCKSSPWGCPYDKYCSSGGEDLTGLVFVKKDKK